MGPYAEWDLIRSDTPLRLVAVKTVDWEDDSLGVEDLSPILTGSHIGGFFPTGPHKRGDSLHIGVDEASRLTGSHFT